MGKTFLVCLVILASASTILGRVSDTVMLLFVSFKLSLQRSRCNDCGGERKKKRENALEGVPRIAVHYCLVTDSNLGSVFLDHFDG